MKKQIPPAGEEVVTEDNVEAEADTNTQQEADEASTETEETETDKETDTEESSDKEEKEIEKTSIPTVPLSDFSNLKDIVSRLIGDDPEKLLEIAEADPKLAQRIKAQFPKRFKEITLSQNDDDIETRVQKAVQEHLERSNSEQALESFKDKLGMTEIEFSDIKKRLDDKARSLVRSEAADNYKQALNLALSIIEPDLYENLETDKVTKKVQERISKAGDSKSVSKKADKGSEMTAMEAKFNKNLPPTFRV